MCDGEGSTVMVWVKCLLVKVNGVMVWVKCDGEGKWSNGVRKVCDVEGK